MVWPIMGDACRQSLHLKDGVEASQRVRRSGRSAPSSTFAFNEQSVNCSGPEVLVLYRKRASTEMTWGARCCGALSIQRLEGSRPRLRRTRALCKFNGGKEQRRTAPRLCRRARHVTV